MPISGCKTVWIPLSLAALLMVLMVAMSHRGIRYDTKISDFLATQPEDGVSVRLDGVIHAMQSSNAGMHVELCDEKACLDAQIPLQFTARLHLNAHVIVSGIYREHGIQVSNVLTRCHHDIETQP